MKAIRISKSSLAALGVAAFIATTAGIAMAKPKATGITSTGPNVTWTASNNNGSGDGAAHTDATLGFWDGGFGSEPNGDSVLEVTYKVNGSGGIAFDYQIQTTDVGFFDYFRAELVTSTGTVNLVSNYNPNPSLFSYYLSPVESFSTGDLSAWKGQDVTLRLIAHQDGFGDEFQAFVTNLRTVGNN